MNHLRSQASSRFIISFLLATVISGIIWSRNASPQGHPPPTLADDFNDNLIDTAKWDANNLFSGFTDTSLAIAETGQRLEIGPLLQHTGGSHYRGIRTVNTYNFSDAYSYVELVQPGSATTQADAMFTIGNSVDAYYRLYVSGGVLYGLRKIGATKTTLLSLSYDAVNHRFLRIRHDAATGNVTLDTAAGSGGAPGVWVQRYSEAWHASISLAGMLFEVKAGTWQSEANAPDKVIFDNFQFGSNGTFPASAPIVTAVSPNSGTTGGGTAVTITGAGFSAGATVRFGNSLATNVTVVSNTSITAITPAHIAGAVNVVITNADAQSGTLNNGYTYNSGPSETVLIADDFNDNSLNTATWDANNLFSGLTDTSLAIAETGQRLEIGPLLQNTGGSHYRGIRTVNTYNFSDAYSYVELVQPGPATTQADAMFTIGNSVDAYYRLYVSGGVLHGLRKIGATKTTLFSLSYDAVNHRFLRIRHDAATGNVTLDTAAGSGGAPGVWVQRYSEAWHASISLAVMLFELKAGTWQPEANAPGKVIFDNFKAAIPGSSFNSPPSAVAGGPYSGSTGESIQFNGSASFDSEGPIETYQWGFGDGSFGTGPAPAHFYTSAGTYTVTLTVTDNTGLTTTGNTTATIYPASNKLPIAKIAGPYSTFTGTATQFSASGSFDPDGSITQYKWDFAGLGTASGPTPSFTFSNTGTHLVSLTVTDNLGAKSWTSINVVVSVSPGEQQAAGDSNVSDWDQFNRRSLDDPSNNRGTLPNAATGNNNFQLVAPVLSLPGRGMDLNLNLVYNSLLWNKSGSEFYYDIDHDWPAPGWHLGFGKLVAMGTAGCLLIEPDGSRHPFTGTVFTYRYPATAFGAAVDVPTFKGQTTDGSLIEYRCEMGSGQPYGLARYPNGTQVYYTNYSTDFSKPKNYLYPYLIVDANGNRISIKYLWELAEPRIERIVDSVGRVISFRYDTQKRLTAITAPGLKDANGSPTTYTFVRLHYRTQPLNLSGAFSGTTHVRNSSPQVIDAIYYPATGTGFWFGADAYSSYGMLKKVTQQRGMAFSVSASTPDEQGTVTQGTVSRIQTYDYPATPANLSSAPVFNSVSESWDGATTSVVTSFVSQENTVTNERTVTVTNPDGTKTVQISFSLNHLTDSDPNKFKNGLTKEERRLDKNGNVIQRTIFIWEQGANGSPRLQRTEITDERGQMLATAYDQYGANNAVGRMREFDYAGVVFRSTLNTFISYQDADLEVGINPSLGGFRIIHPRRINLVASTKIFEGDDSANKLAAYTETKFDEYAEPLKAYIPDVSSSLDLFEFGESRQSVGITGILQHSTSFNPLPPASGSSPNGGAGANYLTKRGNVTSVTRYADTSNSAAPAAPIVEKIKYDMTGNVIVSARICCEELSFNFDNLPTQFAFPVSQTRGSADPNSLLRVTTSASYDLSTGLPLLVKDANGRSTQTTYFPTSLRPKEIVLPTGARTSFEYDDVAMKIVETSRLSASGTIASQITKYFNGLGQVKREEALGANGLIDIVETLYDQFGRPAKQSLPYRAGQTPQWRETIYDAAGRVSEQWEPAVVTGKNPGEANPKTKYFYNEATRPLGASNEPGQSTRTVDAWERSRWVRLDAAGRLAEVIEPNPAGGAGFQTKYSYNALNKLVRVEQGDQGRRFRYDSLGRLTHQKLAETEATLNLSGQWSTAGTANDRWSEVFTYDERSNLISKTDARGVKTIFKYKDSNNVDDPLNRVQSVSYDLAGVPAGLTVLPAPTVTYQYRTKASASDLLDVTQVRQVVAAGVSTEDYDYDGEGRLQEKRLTFAGRPQPMTITYAYDALSRITQTTYPQQYRDNISNPLRKVVVPGYDAASRVTGLKVNNVDYASQITYNAASQITSLLVGTGPNQLTESYTYDVRTELLSSQSVKRGATTLMSYAYGYSLSYCDIPNAGCDPDPKWDFHTGQLTKVTNDGPIGEWKNQKFAYDELGRLKRADQYKWTELNKQTGLWEQIMYWSQSYSYDRFGNRTAVTASNNTALPVTPDGFQSLTFDPASNRITTPGFVYDPAGNQLQNNSGQSFVYDAAGRLAKVKNLSGTTLATYTYGASNRRLLTQTGSESSTDKTYYIWEGDSVIAEYVEQTSATMPKWSKNYIYLGGRLLATEAPNGSGEIVHYHHPDRLSTKLVTNNLDTTSFHQANLPFGTALEAESTGATNRRFTSYDRSTTTGLDYAINRQYDSRQGRFTQVDPLGMTAASLADPQSLNMYSYVGNDPVNRVDPDGQFWGALFRFIAGFFTSLRPNVINGSFTYRNTPPISVSFTPSFQNIGVGYGAIGFAVRSGGQWLPALTSPFVDRFTEAVDAARDILSEDNACSDFFGGAGLGALYELESAVKNAGKAAYSYLGDSITGIRMEIPTQINPSDLPLSNLPSGYISIAPSKVMINSNGPFVKFVSSGTTLSRPGNYNPGSLQSRVLQLLHELGHLVVVRSQLSYKFLTVGGSRRRYEMRALAPLLRLDGNDKDLSGRNTERVLKACRAEINKL